MPYKDTEKKKEYARDYYREYMKTVGVKYRIKSDKKRRWKERDWKNSGALYYKIRTIQKHFGAGGVNAFIRDNFSCTKCNESDFRVLVLHHKVSKLDGGKNYKENLVTLCNNCYIIEHFTEHSLMSKAPQKEWDFHWMNYAKFLAGKSVCLSRKIGAVLVKDNKLLSTGVNGPARGVKHCNERNLLFYQALVVDRSKHCDFAESHYPDECPRRRFGFKSGEGLHLCQAGHAERNALLQAAKNGVSTLGTTLYCYCGQVCKDCAIEIINAGVTRLVYLDGQPVYDKYADVILKESSIVVNKIKFMGDK